jgi:GntR family histidine utilization transcriptional repressor
MNSGFRQGPPAALYQSVKHHVRRLIDRGSWKVGDRIASEHELVAQLGVSRMTVHRALRELADEGVLHRVAGVGTFVADHRGKSNLLAVANLADEIRARGGQHRCDLIEKGIEAASPEVAESLKLAPGTPVFHVVCLHRENGVAVQLEDRYVNPSAAPSFLDQPFGAVLPAEYLLRTVPLDEVEHMVEAEQASTQLARTLEIHKGDACLVLTRRTWCGPMVVTLVRLIHPGTRYRLGSRFRPQRDLAVG